MKILYYALHDPNVLDLSSGVDFFLYRAICEYGFDVQPNGPIKNQLMGIEKLATRFFQRTGKRFVKYHMSVAWKESRAINQAVKLWKPDVVLTCNMPSLVFYNSEIPAVFCRDTTFFGQQEFWPVYGRVAHAINLWQEKRAIRNSAYVITNSIWSKQVISTYYKKNPDKIGVFILASALMPDVVPQKIEVLGWKKIEFPLRLLLVGRDSIPHEKVWILESGLSIN